MEQTRVMFRTWKHLPKRGQVVAVLVDSKLPGSEALRIGYNEKCQSLEIDMYEVKFETRKAPINFYAKLLDDLHSVVGYESIMVVDSLSDIRKTFRGKGAWKL